MGLHRDIKPSNILVSEGNFVLTDFGLSTFKSVTETSQTPFRVGGGDCLPPECEDLQTLCKGVVRRSGDIWALGCVVLELLVYMREGPTGIEKFREERVVQAAWKVRTFHGPGKEVNPYVRALMDRLYGSGTQRADRLIDLIRSMLQIEAEARPKAPKVTTLMRFIATNELVYSLEDAYSIMLQATGSIQGIIEYWKLKSWHHVVNSLIDKNDESSSTKAELFNKFEEIITMLKESQVEVQRICAVHDSTGRALFHDLRRMNGTLMENLSEEARNSAWTYLDLNCLSKEDITSSEMSQLADSDDFAVPRRLATQAYAKKFSKEISTAYDAISSEKSDITSANLKLDTEAVEIDKTSAFQDHNLGWVSTAPNESKQRVLIEWIKYDLHWEGAIQTEMIQRVLKIATSLHKLSSKASALRILRCIHYYHNERKKAFGLIYSLPDPTPPPQTLNTLIKETVRTNTYKSISHESRLHLAHTLASTLLTLHTATLVHKSISSHNILLPSSSLDDPYLIGFDYARPVEPSAFTTGPPPSAEAQRYFHPEYDAQRVSERRPFHLVYDYYSLGLVLVEIGLWETVDRLVLGAKSATELGRKVREGRVPLLEHMMGTKYMDAVVACLEGGVEQNGDEEFKRTVMGFQRRVVGALRDCLVGRGVGDHVG